jgi:hypothetical protein
MTNGAWPGEVPINTERAHTHPIRINPPALRQGQRSRWRPRYACARPPGLHKATIAVHELNEVRPLADLYAWSYRRSCQRHDTTVQVAGFDEIAARYRQSRRALVAGLVRAKVPPREVTNWITTHVLANVEPEHREKFVSDVLAEVAHLDASRIGGLGITRQELDAWLELRAH